MSTDVEAPFVADHTCANSTLVLTITKKGMRYYQTDTTGFKLYGLGKNYMKRGRIYITWFQFIANKQFRMEKKIGNISVR